MARSHARELLGFAARFPGSKEALRALDGIVAFPASARPDLASLRPVAAKIIEERRATNDVGALRQVSAMLRVLGDNPDATKAQDLAGGHDVEAGAPTFVSHGDPLEAQCSGNPVQSAPAEVVELFKQEMLLGRHIADSCKSVARNDDDEYIRLAIRDGRVERAVLLDPEAPKELRQCIENAALRETRVPAGLGTRRVIRVMFPPKQ